VTHSFRKEKPKNGWNVVCVCVSFLSLSTGTEGEEVGLVLIDPISLRSSYFLLLLIPVLCFLITHGWLWNKHAKEKPLEN